METIFTLLIILLPIVFKLIGKKLEKAGQQSPVPEHDKTGPQEVLADWAEVLRRHLEAQQTQVPVEMAQDHVEAGAEVKPAAVAHADVRTEQNSKQTVRVNAEYKAKSSVMPEPANEGMGKIDKKKLIVYSEIMKPKYTE